MKNRELEIAERLSELAEERKALLREFYTLPGGLYFSDAVEDMLDEIETEDDHDPGNYIFRKTHVRGIYSLRCGWVCREFYHRKNTGRGGLAERAVRRFLKWSSDPVAALQMLDARIDRVLDPNALARWEIRTLGSRRIQESNQQEQLKD